MSGAVLMAWGPFQFETGAAAYEELRHRASARWEKHAIIGRRPAGQHLGPGEESVSLRGTIYPDVTGAGSAATVNALLAAAQQAQVYTLLSADGTIIGPFRLEKAESTGSFIDPAGAPQKLTYDLEFVAHDDGAGQIFSLWP